MIRHILLIAFKSFVEPSQIAEVRQLFEAIPEKVPGVLTVEWGVNDSPENLNRGYTHSVLMTFADEQGRQTYLPHAEHDALKRVFTPLLQDIVVFDYLI
ncbi:Dabb family protein [Saccharospirillum impatiens]|uniref:Dabb family protein n=1 Tax=Saccharospirillum impatiens TaxID=169438 RepID=UPI00041716BF|nr:Dabb family protein [Saccharospirillum impatiens]